MAEVTGCSTSESKHPVPPSRPADPATRSELSRENKRQRERETRQKETFLPLFPIRVSIHNAVPWPVASCPLLRVPREQRGEIPSNPNLHVSSSLASRSAAPESLAPSSRCRAATDAIAHDERKACEASG